MKRMIAYLAVLVMLLSACSGEPKPDDRYSENTVTAMKAAIETLDDFLSYNLTAEEASEKLDRIANTMDQSDLNARIAETSISTASTLVGICGRYADWGDSDKASEAMKDVKESRDSLYNSLYGK